MSRPRKSPLYPVALSAESAAIALAVPARWIRQQVELGRLPAYTLAGCRARILVADLVELVRQQPRHFKRKRSPQS